MNKVIVVVVTHNRQKLLAECITALRNQTRQPDSILVIFVFGVSYNINIKILLVRPCLACHSPPKN